MAIGALAFHFMTHRYDAAEARMRDVHSPHVMHWFLVAQLARGILLGFVLYPLRGALLAMGWWGGLVLGSILFMIASIIGINGAIEAWVYTYFNLDLFLAHVPEVVIQTMLFGYLLLAWERRIERKQRTTRRAPEAALEPTAVPS
jgi:hypothetical protein